MDHGVEIFVPDRRQDLEPDAVIFELPWRNVVGAAIDGNVVATGHKPRREVFCEGFKSAVTGGNTSCTENCDPHLTYLYSRWVATEGHSYKNVTRETCS